MPMIAWNTRAVRHVPEDELHAYLDQALSRSQCVEIETHLSACARCRHGRGDIAAPRDRRPPAPAPAPRPCPPPAGGGGGGGGGGARRGGRGAAPPPPPPPPKGGRYD